MSNRIIDLTLSSGIVGTESIPGTEQVAIEETTPKNKRYTWNMVLDWIKSKTLNSALVLKNLAVSSRAVTGTQLFAAGTSITGIVLCENSTAEEMVYPVSVKIGTTAGGDDILPLTECPLGNGEGTRISISYFKNTSYILYLTMTAYEVEPDYMFKVAVIFETLKTK